MLIEALREVAAKEVECERLSDSLLRARAALQELGDSRSLLFQEHHNLRKERAAERRALEEKARKAEAEAEDLRRQLEAATDLVERLRAAPPEQLRADLTAAARKLAMLQVKEQRLHRALEAATAGEQAARADREEAMRDLEEVSEVARARISSLERERAAARAREERLAAQLQQSAPRREVEAAREELRSLQAHHRVQLEESTGRVLQEGEYKRAVDEAAMARARAAAAEAEAQAVRARLRVVEEELRKPPAGGDAALAQLRSEAVVLRVDVESAALDAAHQKAERQRAEEGKAELQRRVQDLEARLARLVDAAHAAHEGERKAREQLAACVPEAEHRERVRRGEAAEQEARELREQVGVLRDRLRAAEAAAARKAALTDLRDAELKALRQALRDHARESDVKLALARANEEIVRLRSRDAELRHRVHIAVRRLRETCDRPTRETHPRPPLYSRRVFDGPCPCPLAPPPGQTTDNDALEEEVKLVRKELDASDNRVAVLRADLRSAVLDREAREARLEAMLAGRVSSAKAEEWAQALRRLTAAHAEARKAAMEAIDRAGVLSGQVAELEGRAQLHLTVQALLERHGEAEAVADLARAVRFLSPLPSCV